MTQMVSSYQIIYFPFHRATRSGTTPAHDCDVDTQSTKRHSTWRSDMICRYIVADPNNTLGEEATFYDFPTVRFWVVY